VIYHFQAFVEKDGETISGVEEEFDVTDPRNDSKTPDRAAEITAWQRAIRTLADWKPGYSITLVHVTRGRLPNSYTSANESIIPQEYLTAESEYLRDDRDLYLECLNGKPLKDRTEKQEVRDGLILFHHVYEAIRNGE
jgi:hypothetical protein